MFSVDKNKCFLSTVYKKIVTVIMERIHGELLNILLAFPCRMYSMNHEGTGFLCCIWCVCVLHTLRIDSFYYVNR